MGSESWTWGLLDDLPFGESLGRFGGILESKRSDLWIHGTGPDERTIFTAASSI